MESWEYRRHKIFEQWRGRIPPEGDPKRSAYDSWSALTSAAEAGLDRLGREGWEAVGLAYVPSASDVGSFEVLLKRAAPS